MSAPKTKSAPREAGSPGLWIFLASFFLYALTSSPAIGWLDSPEFIAQAATLGISHSPGHPLPALLGRLATFLPIGDIVWRINLMSSLCAATAVWFLFRALAVHLQIITPVLTKRTRTAIAMAISLVAACAWALWSNAVRAEVYALQALVTTGAYFFLLRFEEEHKGRWLLAASLLCGLGLANHHLMTLTVLIPAALVICIPRSRPSLRLSMWTAAIGVVGLFALAYLPIRSLAHPLVNFGAPHTLDRFLWTLSGAAFTKSAVIAHVSPPAIDAVQIIIALSEALTLPLFLLSLGGTYALLRTPTHRRIGLLLFGIVFTVVFVRVMLGFDPETPDHHAYLLPAILALFLLATSAAAGLATVVLNKKPPIRAAPVVVAAALALIVPIQLLANWDHSDHSRSWGSNEFAHWELDELPPSSVLLLAYFQSTFRQWALTATEGYRPDLTVLDRSFLTYPGMKEEAIRRNPDLETLIAAPLKAGAPTPTSYLSRLAETRPVMVQLHINVDPPLAKAISPAGSFARWVDRANASRIDSWNANDMNSRDRLETRLESASKAEYSEVRAALVWHDVMRLDAYCGKQQTSLAAMVYARVRRLAPEDTSLKQMAIDCRLETP